MASSSLLDNSYKQALSAQLPKTFFLGLYNFFEECNNNTLLKATSGCFKGKNVHFWELSEKFLLEQPITLPAQFFALGHVTITDINRDFSFSKFLNEESIEHSWHRLDFVYQLLKNHKTIRNEKITKNELFIVKLLDREVLALNSLIDGKNNISKDFDINEYKKDLQRIFDFMQQVLSDSVLPQKNIKPETHTYSFDASGWMKIDNDDPFEFVERNKAYAFEVLKIMTASYSKKYSFLEIHKKIHHEPQCRELDKKQQKAIRGYCRSINDRFNDNNKKYPDFLIVKNNTIRINPVYQPI